MYMQEEDKERINMLSPINNIFGTHEGRMAPMIKFLVASSTPFLLYIFMFQMIIPFKAIVIFEVIWTIRMALYILLDEPTKYKRYKIAKANKYADAYSLNRISHRYENSLIEYEDGKLALIIYGYPAFYMNDDLFSDDMEKFISQFDDYDMDISLQLHTREFELKSESEKLKIYTDKKFMSERMDIYNKQDEFVDKKSKLYKYVFTIKCAPYQWKNMMELVQNVLESSIAKVFYMLELATRSDVSDICSRDLGTLLSIDDMLHKKYVNDDFNGSKVLWYGDKIPKQYLIKEVVDDVSKRRVLYVDES